MPYYRRAVVPGGTFFITIVTDGREPLFADPAARERLRVAIARCRHARPFELDAIVLLPDHLHLILTLPLGDADFSTRLAAIKATFTRDHLKAGGRERRRSPSRVAHRNRGVWQKRFWEHAVRDADDLNNHLDYVHYNPVKHGLSSCPHGWEHSSFGRWVERGGYDRHWQCACDGNAPTPPSFDGREMGDWA
jgi:putative transposase